MTRWAHGRTGIAPIAPIALLALAATVFVGCSDTEGASRSAATSAPTTTSATTPAATTNSQTSTSPEPGDCLAPMTGPIARGSQLPAIVECGEPHGGEIISVEPADPSPTAPYPALGQRLVGVEDALAACAGTDGNGGKFEEFVGANNLTISKSNSSTTGVVDAWAVSGIEVAAFVPGPAAWASGQRWVACSVVLNNNSTAPAAYNGSVEGVRSKFGSLAAELGWCKLQESDAAATGFSTVSCASPHNYEQVVSFPAAGNDADFPGEPAMDDLGTKLCEPLASEATGKRTDSMAPGFGLSWSFPQSDDWADGDRIVRCYVSTLEGLSSGSVGSGTEASST